MKTILLFLITFSAYSAVLQEYDHLLEGLGGGGGGGGGAVDSVFGRTGNVISIFGDYGSFEITNLPYTQLDSSGDIVATDVQAALNELADEKADLTGDISSGNLALEAVNIVRLKDSDTTELVTIQASPTTAANYTLTLPIDDGLSGQKLTTDGNGVLSWNTPRILQDDNGDSSVIIDSVADEIYFSTSGVLRGEILADGTVYIGDVVTNTNDEGITYKPTTLNVGIGNDTPDASAILDIASTTDGILIPRMTTLQRTSIVTPANGLLVYDIDVNDFMYFDADLLPAPGQWRYLNRRMTDIDADTGIVLDEISDEDKIRFDTATAERMIIDDIGNVGIGTSTPDPSAILDLSSTSKGVVLPRMTTAERDVIFNPTDGLLVYDTTANDYLYFDAENAKWKNLNKEMVDADGNTGIIVDEIADENKIRFVTADGAGAATQRMVLNEEGELYIGPELFPNPTAILEIESTTKGVVLPRMTTLQREAIPTPATGLIVFDSDIGKYFYFNGSYWLTMDGVGHGALTAYSFTVSPTQITLDQETTFNFQRIDGVTGQEEDARVVLPAGTVVATFNVDVLPNDIRYISLVYDWDLQTFSYNYGTNPNNIDIGKEILLTGPFTDGAGFIGTVNFYHYAVQSAASYGDYLADVQRARVIDGMQLSFALPNLALPQDGSRYELLVASGRTHNSLLRSPEGAVTSFEPKNTATVNEVYYYAPNVPAYTFVAPNSGVINVGQYWNPDTLTFNTAANNQFTVTAIFAYPGNTANQYLGLLVDDQSHSSLANAKNAIFNGEVLEGKPAGLDSAALVGYLVIQGNDTADHGNFQAADQGVTWDIIGPKDNISLTITAGGSVIPLTDLSDVDTTGVNPQQILAYDGVNWVDSEYIPRNMTEVVRDTLPALTAGTLVFNTTTNQLNVYNGATWTILGAGGGSSSQIQDVDTDTFITTEQTPDSDSIFMQLGTTLGVYTWSLDKTSGWQVNWNDGTDNSFLNYDLGTGLLTIRSDNNGTRQAGIRLGANEVATYTTIQPNVASTDWTLTLPADGGIAGQYLQTDGNGNTTWAAAAGGGGGVSIQDTSTGFTRVTTENVLDDRTIRMFVPDTGNTAGIEKFTLTRTDATLSTPNGLTIDPLRDDGNPTVAGSTPLNVTKYTFTGDGQTEEIANFAARIGEAGNLFGFGDGGYLGFTGEGTTSGVAVTLGRLEWYNEIAADPTGTQGLIEFKVKDSGSTIPVRALRIRPAELEISATSSKASSIELNDVSNTNTVKLSVPDNVTTNQTIKLPAAAPTTLGQVLSVLGTAGGITDLEWTTPASVPDITETSSSIRIGNTLVQWGVTGTISGGGNQLVTFPISYTANPRVIVTSRTRNSYVCATGTGGSGSTTTTQVRIYVEAGATNVCDWVAIGRKTD